VALANEGNNPTAIIKLKSGWVVLGDNQKLPGYCLLLSDPVAETLNDLDCEKRNQFLSDMTLVGDALLRALKPRTINYSILGNADRALHAHIHPRYEWEPVEEKNKPPFIYDFKNEAKVSFSLERDIEIMMRIKEAIESIQLRRKEAQ